MISLPVPFGGSPEQAAVNRRTHDFTGIDGRCYDCDSRPSYEAANYPCGATVPRFTR